MWAIHLEEAIALFPGTSSLISSFLHASICSSVQQTLPRASRAPGIGCPREQGVALTLGTWLTGWGGKEAEDRGCRVSVIVEGRGWGW